MGTFNNNFSDGSGSDFGSDPFDSGSSEERLCNEAEDLMRQGRFQDAASCYEELCTLTPSDMWASLAYVSALECAGQLGQAEQVMSDLAHMHRHNASIHRFQHLFFERREDYSRSILCQEMMRETDYQGRDDGPVDQLADLYFNQGRYHEALKELERIYQQDEIEDKQLRATILGRIGACHRQQDDLDQARCFLTEALDYDNENNWLLTELAETERADDNYASALSYYEQALLHQKKDHFARSRLAQLEFENGNAEKAIVHYNTILEAQPRAYWAMIELAQILTTSDPDRSYNLCQDVLDNDATIPAAYSQLGQLSRNQGNLKKARKYFQDALAVSPNANWILHELADISYQLGKKEEAETHLTQARNNDPFDPITYGVHADFLRNENDLEQAVPFLQKAVELDKGYTWAWRELAEVQALVGNAAEAQIAHEAYADLENNSAYCDGLQAFILNQDGKRRASIPYLERAVLQQPDYLWAWRELIDFHLHNQDFASAEDTTREALKHFKKNPAFWGMLTESLRQQNKTDQALTAIEKAVSCGEKIPQLWALHAELYMDHDINIAISSAKRARALDPAREYAILHAQCLLSANHNKEAQQIVSALLDEGNVDSHLFDFASEISVRNHDFDAAVLWCDRGLEENTNNKRLLLRRGILASERSEDNAEDLLLTAFAIPTPVIWREFILPFAHVGNMTNSRRAAYNYINSCASSGDTGNNSDNSGNSEQAHAWLILAEAELIQKNMDEAEDSLRESLRIDPQCVPAQLLCGMIAEQNNDFDTAEKHLAQVFAQVCEQEQKQLQDPSNPASTHDSEVHSHSERESELASEQAPSQVSAQTSHQKHIDTRLLLRQLSHIEEQRHNIDAARHYLHQLGQRSSHHLQFRIDQAAFELRHQEHAKEAEKELLELLDTHKENQQHQHQQQCQRILHHLAWYYLRTQSATDAYQWLNSHNDLLETTHHHLAAQLALAHAAFDEAEKHIHCIAEDERNDQHNLVLCRALIGRGDHEAAQQHAHKIWEENPSNEESAILLSEAMSYQGHYRKALDILSDHRLPQQGHLISDERFFLCVCLQLEVHSTSNCLSYLGSKNPATVKDVPLKRVFHAAFGSAWGDSKIKSASADDILSLPPFTSALFRLGKSLARNKKTALASQTLILTHTLAYDNEEHSLCAQISIPLVKLLLLNKQRKSAWNYAWKAKSPKLLLRCLF